MPIKRKKPPLIHTITITQLLKAVRKGHIIPPEPNRLSIARHRRGKRGHETQGFAR